jgi:flagellar export protein FliJ
MRPFRFRAAIVLDLRRKQDEAAQRRLALAKADLLVAERALAAADAALVAAQARAAEAEASAEEVTLLQWYRNWMTGRQDDVARARRRVDECRTAVAEAAGEAVRARRDLRVIERYRDRVWQAWQREALREEQKALDWLGTLQHAMRRTAPGGQ